MNASSHALRIIAHDNRPSISFMLINKNSGRAYMLSIGVFTFVSRMIRPTSIISSVQVQKHERRNGRPGYGIAIRVRQGDHIKFGCHSRDQAMHIAQKISHYLG